MKASASSRRTRRIQLCAYLAANGGNKDKKLANSKLRSHVGKWVGSDPYTGSTFGMCGDGEEAQKAKTKDDTKMCEYYDLKQPALRWCFPCEASRIFASKANVSEEDRELVQRCARRHMHPGDSSPLSKRASDTCMSSLGCRLVCNKAGWESNSERRFCDHDNNLSHRSFPGRRKIRLSAW